MWPFARGGDTWSADYDERGMSELVSCLRTAEPTAVLLEATGGLEVPLVSALAAAALPVVVVNPRQVRDFAKATGKLAKTDALDAQVLAHFAEAVRPPVRPLRDEDTQELNSLTTRRNAAQKNPVDDHAGCGEESSEAICCFPLSLCFWHPSWVSNRTSDRLESGAERPFNRDSGWANAVSGAAEPGCARCFTWVHSSPVTQSGPSTNGWRENAKAADYTAAGLGARCGRAAGSLSLLAYIRGFGEPELGILAPYSKGGRRESHKQSCRSGYHRSWSDQHVAVALDGRGFRQGQRVPPGQTQHAVWGRQNPVAPPRGGCYMACMLVASRHNPVRETLAEHQLPC